MEVAVHREGHEESGEGGRRGQNDGMGGGGGIGGGIISPNRSALNGMGEYLLMQVRCWPRSFWWSDCSDVCVGCLPSSDSWFCLLSLCVVLYQVLTADLIFILTRVRSAGGYTPPAALAQGSR